MLWWHGKSVEAACQLVWNYLQVVGKEYAEVPFSSNKR